MAKKKSYPTIHLAIYRLFKNRANGRLSINHDCVRDVMSRTLYKFPKSIHYSTLKEMEELKLIKRHGNTRSIFYELTGGNADNILNNLI